MLQKLSNLSRRLEQLEKKLKPDVSLGWYYFVTHDGENFSLTSIAPTLSSSFSPRPIDYREALGLVVGSEQIFKREDLDKLTIEGWQVLILHYVAMPH